jgi:hypothetical protein
MPKGSVERSQYYERIKGCSAVVKDLLKREQQLLQEMSGSPDAAAAKRLSLVEAMLNLASYYLVMNGISQAVLKQKNEDSLNEARKSLYKSIIYLEAAVSGLVDAPLSEYEDKLDAIQFMDAAERYRLVRKIGLAIQLMENAYGVNTKWRWTFVELEGRYAAVTKNLLDAHSISSGFDHLSPDYEPSLYHLRLVKKLLLRTANRYREMYELSTGRIDDFQKGIAFLSALRRLYMATGDRYEMALLEKKLDRWNDKLESDRKKQNNRAGYKTSSRS